MNLPFKNTTDRQSKLLLIPIIVVMGGYILYIINGGT